MTLQQDGRYCGLIKIPVRIEQSRCAGIETLAFAMGGTSMASGTYSGIQGKTVRDLLGTYRGQARGVGLGAAYGSWSASSEQRIAISGSVAAIPLPITGGDIGLGVTSCKFSYAVKDLGVATVSESLGQPETQVPFEQIADLPL
jgi:hypothetical protein